MMKILNISERAGGMTLNDARALTKDVLGMESEDYPKSFDMEDIGNVPLAVINAMTVLKEYGKDDEDDKKTPFDNGEQKPEFLERQLEEQIEKAADNHEDEVVAVMKEVRRLLKEMGGAS